MGKLQINISQSDRAPDITILALAGDLDIAAIGSLIEAFKKIVASNAGFVIADMSGVTLLSSAALGELMGGRKALIEHGGDMVLAGLSLPLKTKVSLLGANKIFHIHTDIREAIAAYKWEREGRSEQFSLSFPPHLKFVPAVRQFASRLVARKGYSRRDAFRIETIVDEICNNAIEHAPEGLTQDVTLAIGIDRDKVEVDVKNVSDPKKLKTLEALLDPSRASSVHSENDCRGRGLALVKLLSNELNIDLSEHGTSVHATKLKEE